LNSILRTIIYLACVTGICGAAGADTLLHSVTGYTSTANGDIKQFRVLIFDDEGRIVATGGDDLIAGRADARQVDGRGRFVLPGLVDSHAHMSNQGFLTIQLNLTGTPSVEDSVERIALYARTNPGSGWIEGRGWNQVLWPVKEFPTAAHIDAVVSDRPVWLRRIDGHAGWANSKALAIAGIDDDTPDPFGGKIIRDSNGHATGTLVDKAMSLVDSKLPPPSREGYRKAFLAAFRQLTSLGLTSVHDAGINIMEAGTYMSMVETAWQLRLSSSWPTVRSAAVAPQCSNPMRMMSRTGACHTGRRKNWMDSSENRATWDSRLPFMPLAISATSSHLMPLTRLRVASPLRCAIASSTYKSYDSRKFPASRSSASLHRCRRLTRPAI
jgi:predicted amidohydrolase YtcJ